MDDFSIKVSLEEDVKKFSKDLDDVKHLKKLCDTIIKLMKNGENDKAKRMMVDINTNLFTCLRIGYAIRGLMSHSNFINFPTVIYPVHPPYMLDDLSEYKKPIDKHYQRIEKAIEDNNTKELLNVLYDLMKVCGDLVYMCCFYSSMVGIYESHQK